MTQQTKQNQAGHNSGAQTNTSNRGFAAIDKDKQKETASKGSKSSHKNGDSKSATNKKNK